LTDAGPASQFDEQSTAAEPLTREGAIIGTASYMSPEQAEGKRVDARSDIFSFGSVLYEMVTGRRAFDGGSGISTLSAVLRDEVKPIPDLAPDVPMLYQQIIAMCLRKDPNARWQSMKEVENALDGLKRQLDPGARPSPTPVPTTIAAGTGPSLPPPLPPKPAAAGPPPVPPVAPPPLPVKPSAAPTVTAAPPPVPPRVGATPPPIPQIKPAAAAPPAPPPVPSKPAAPAATPPPVPAKPAAPLPVGAIAQPPAKSKPAMGLLVLLLVLILLLGGGAAGAWWWWKQQHKPTVETTTAQIAPPQTAAPTSAPAAPAPEPVPEATPAAPVETALTNDAVLQMVQAKVPISQINQQIRSSKTNFTLTPEEVARLRKAGVPSAVIQVMRNPKGVAPPPAPAPGSSPPTVAATTPPPVPPPTRPAPAPKTSPDTAAAPRRPVIQTVPVTVNDALPFRIVLADDVAANGQEGQALRFVVADGFKVGDTVVIPPGATVTGSVTSEAGKKFLGIGNKMTFRLLQADAVDGQKINVRCKSGKQSNGPTTRPFDTGKNPKAKGLAASQGTEYIAYIDGDQTVSVRK
jgi:hypothetical protein